MSGLLDTVIGEVKPEECDGETKVVCDTTASSEATVSGNSFSGNYSVLYPAGVSDIPLAGGAIVKLSSNIDKPLDFSLAPQVVSYLKNDVSKSVSIVESISSPATIQKKIEILNKVQVSVNDFFNKYQQPKFNHKKQPRLNISLGSNNTDGSKVTQKGFCGFKFVPLEVIKEIAKNIRVTSTSGDFVGISGYSFQELAGEGESDEQITRLLFEFFPIYNLSQSQIQSGNIVFGGCYTANSSGDIFIKMPDLSGRSSSGVGTNFYTLNDLSLSVNLFYKGAYSETQIKRPRAPICSTVLTKSVDYKPDEDLIEISIDVVGAEYGDLKNCYLSLVNSSIKTNKDVKSLIKNSSSAARQISNASSGITTSLSKLEEFTFPVLTKSYLGGKPFVSESEKVNYRNSYAATNMFFDMDQLSKEDENPFDISLAGFSSSSFLGLKNRPDILLSTERSTSNGLNDKIYFSDLSSSIYPLFSSVMPKVGSIKPNAWIKGLDFTQTSDGETRARFSLSDIIKVLKKKDSKLDTSIFNIFNGDISFALYIEDAYGQISRSYGQNFSIKSSKPIVTSVQPSGYKDSQIIDLSQTNIIIAFNGTSLLDPKSVDLVNAAGSIVYTLRDGDEVGTTIWPATDEQFSVAFNPFALSQKIQISDDITQLFLIANTISGSGEKTEARIALSINSTIALPDRTSVDLDLNIDEFFSDVNSDIMIEGASSKIKIYSKTSKFSSEKMFAYLAFDSKESASSFANESNLYQVNTGGKVYYIAKDIEFELSKNKNDDFYKKDDKQAVLSLPGKYSAYNFSSLADKAFSVLVTGRTISDFAPTGTINQSLIQNKYSLISFSAIGSLRVVGLAAQQFDANQKPISSVKLIKDKFLLNEIEELKGFSNVSSSGINISKKSDTFFIVFYGPNPYESDYRFYFGTKDITKKRIGQYTLSNRPNYYMAKFSNISYSSESIANIYITSNNKKTSCKSSSQLMELKLTHFVEDESAYLDTASGDITISSEVSNSISDTFKSGSGVFFKENTDSTQSGFVFYDFYNSVSFSVSSRLSAYLKVGDNDLQKQDMYPLVRTTDIRRLQSSINTFSVPQNSIYSQNEYVKTSLNGKSGYFVFSKIGVSDPCTVKFDYPEIISINGLSVNASEISLSADYFTANSDLKIQAKNAGDNLIITIDGVEISAISKETLANYVTEFVARVPDSALIGATSCPKVCVSKANAAYLGAEVALGSTAIAFLGNGIVEQVKNFEDGIGDAADAKEKIEQSPLRFFNVLLDNANVPPELINSFCDFSYELTANLQFSLSTFKTYLVPIKVIFAIIDVICSLINPVKLARAVINLFRAIIDLIALLPQVSIPIMFLQLALHLLELIKCVVPEIQRHIYTINSIISAIEIAVVDRKYQALYSLEDSLDSYIKNVEIDLQFLDPVVQIFAIFMEFLEMAFSLSCITSNGEDVEYACGIDPTLLAGIVGGVMAPEDDILPNALIPVAQPYTDESIEDATASGNGSNPFNFPEDFVGTVVAEKVEDTYLDSLTVDLDSMRPNNFDFPITFAPTVTKTRRRRKNIVRFLFNQRGDGGKKVIDPVQTLDAPLTLLVKDTDNGVSSLKIRSSTSKGNFISPIDGNAFIEYDGDDGTVKPLELTFELPEYELNETTGELIQTGLRIVTRTFDDIPSMAIMDEDFNLYFIAEGGIKMKEVDGLYFVDNILSKMVNQPAAPKLKFSKEEVTIDSDEDGDLDDDDDVIDVFDFPQIYFVDMRQCKEQIQQACFNTSMNSFMLENQTDDIRDIVEVANDCVNDFINTVKSSILSVKNSVSNGRIPAKINIGNIQSANDKMVECITQSADDICKYAINTLSTSFLIENDPDIIAKDEYPDVSAESDEAPPYLGAAEFASGIGDSIQIPAETFASILIIPRDAYNQEVIANLSSKISLEIISDETGSAQIVYDDGEGFVGSSSGYRAKVTASNIGVVRIRAKICQRTVQAITYAGLEIEEETENKVDCIDDLTVITQQEDIPLGALTKVDRILTIFFTKVENYGTDSMMIDEVINTSPQTSGTSLEN